MVTPTYDTVAVGAATLPYAMANLGEHIIDHALPSPLHVDADPRAITVWLHEDHAPAWRATTDTLTGPARGASRVGAFDTYSCLTRLHGSCVEVTLRWITFWAACEHPECHERVAPADAPNHDAGCAHGRDLCSLHRLHCADCVSDLREDRAVALADGLREWGAQS